MRKFVFLILIIPFLTVCKSQPLFQPSTKVLEPSLKILSIAVIQAELINTEFEAVLSIDNPNDFPVELSSIRYELHGNGIFWADGKKNDVLSIPAKSSRETRICFSMNFINMNRRLLNDVIRMRFIQYRFKGDIEVKTEIPRASYFTVFFDCSGLSEVRRRANG